MAVAHRASIGAALTTNTTGATLVIPASVATDDILFVISSNRDANAEGTLTDNDTGGNTWTSLGHGGPSGAAGWGTLWWKRATSATASKTVTLAGQTGSCSMVLSAFSGALASGNPYEAVNFETNAANDGVHAGFTPSVSGTFVCLGNYGLENDEVWGGQSTTDPGALLEFIQHLNTGGSDCSTAIAGAIKNNVNATGNFVWTAIAANTTVSVRWAILPAAGGAAQDLTPGLVTNSQTFHVPVVTKTYALTPGLFTDADTFHVPVVTRGAVGLTPGLFTNTNTFFAPTVTKTYALTPALFTDTDTFFAPTVTRGAVGLTPGLFTDTDTFFAPVVNRGAVGLTPALFTDTDTFFAPTVTRGAVGLTLALFTDTDTFFAATITAGAVSLTPGLLTDADTFFAPTVAGGTVTLLPGLFTNTQTFFAPDVGQANVLQDLAPALFTDGDTFFAPTVSVGLIVLAPELFTNDNTFFAPTVAAGAGATQNLAPLLFTNVNTFFSPTVGGGVEGEAGADDAGRRSRRLSKYRLRPISDKVYADRLDEEEIIMAVVKEFMRVVQ